MKLSEFSGDDAIFVDANIFVYHFTGNKVYGHICSDFLERIEFVEVEAVTTSLVLDEVVYAILITAASQVTGITRIKTLQKRLKSDVNLSAKCYSMVSTFLQYIEVLRGGGLTVIERPGLDQIKAAAELGKKGLVKLPHDILVIKMCKDIGVTHIATQDPDFDDCEDFVVWKPMD